MEIKGKRRTGTLVFLLLVLFVCILCAVSAAGIDRRISGVTIVPLLVGRCQMEIYDRTTQPVFTVAAACPGVDMIRLWPLPILQPWFEDPIFPANDGKIIAQFPPEERNESILIGQCSD